jgi:hypothetical protein
MGTSKRERQKAGHQARLNVERAYARRDHRRRRLLSAVIVVVVALGIGVLLKVINKPGTSATAAATTTTSTPSSTTTLPSVAGQPCVAFNDTLPAGAPEVAIPVGPPPTSLVIADLIPGSGTPITSADTITVNYIGVSCSTGKIFDSSWSRGQAATFPLTQVIPGWTKGLDGMMPGGRRQLVIPPDLAYGATGQGSIAPDETLIFVVDLISSTPTTTSTSAPTASSTP